MRACVPEMRVSASRESAAVKTECDACQRDKTVTLQVGGDTVCTYCERYRHECEARHVCGLADQQARRDYLAAVEKHRGHDARWQLEQTARTLWTLRHQRAG